MLFVTLTNTPNPHELVVTGVPTGQLNSSTYPWLAVTLYVAVELVPDWLTNVTVPAVCEVWSPQSIIAVYSVVHVPAASQLHAPGPVQAFESVKDAIAKEWDTPSITQGTLRNWLTVTVMEAAAATGVLRAGSNKLTVART